MGEIHQFPSEKGQNEHSAEPANAAESAEVCHGRNEPPPEPQIIVVVPPRQGAGWWVFGALIVIAGLLGLLIGQVARP